MKTGTQKNKRSMKSALLSLLLCLACSSSGAEAVGEGLQIYTGCFELELQTDVGKQYQLQTSTDMVTWEPFVTAVSYVDDNGVTFASLGTPGSPTFEGFGEPAYVMLSSRGSATRFFRLVDLSAQPMPSNFVTIPAGSFMMGDSFSEGDSDELPVHEVYVSEFYLQSTEVTYSQWQAVYNWATSNGYTFDNAGSGKGADHPVHTVNWYDVVKWLNAWSEKDGLTPCYTVSGSVYRTGQNDSVLCDWSANGYRLPTEAEWEKASRGGLSGNRFPWGDTISHPQANYNASGGESYDNSNGAGYHPDYYDGGSPYTSPVGSFSANGYGLYDMSGNVWEWCWDWYDEDYYGSSPGSDPRGADSGMDRVLRGGGWYGGAWYLRCSDRSGSLPGGGSYHLGFRPARGH